MQVNKIDNTNFQGKFINNEQIRRLNTYALHHGLSSKLDNVITAIDKNVSPKFKLRLTDNSIKVNTGAETYSMPFDAKSANPMRKDGVEYLIKQLNRLLPNKQAKTQNTIKDETKAFEHIWATLDKTVE